MRIFALFLFTLTALPAYSEDVKDITPLSELIADPRKYNGKKVALIGYLRLEFEEDALYFNKVDFEKHKTLKSIWIDRSEAMRKDLKLRKIIKTKQVVIEGVLDANSRGHMAAFAAKLKEITRCEPWPVVEN